MLLIFYQQIQDAILNLILQKEIKSHMSYDFPMLPLPKLKKHRRLVDIYRPTLLKNQRLKKDKLSSREFCLLNFQNYQ
ncbi:hypothetical protein YA29_05540 [Klebsiella aerogenes]|nr:hypothetical protein YA29_05540 [Klebsiella aerogenes]KLF39234.1 hypothetical protein YA31_02495 [Klebsiella aerogenes]KLF79680.1 hypothetical protein YA40_02800 [Klebsiella aerogenes]